MHSLEVPSALRSPPSPGRRPPRVCPWRGPHEGAHGFYGDPRPIQPPPPVRALSPQTGSRFSMGQLQVFLLVFLCFSFTIKARVWVWIRIRHQRWALKKNPPASKPHSPRIWKVLCAWSPSPVSYWAVAAPLCLPACGAQAPVGASGGAEGGRRGAAAHAVPAPRRGLRPPGAPGAPPGAPPSSSPPRPRGELQSTFAASRKPT